MHDRADFGSDLAHIQCSAVDMGDHYVVNGCKTFISNGMVADLFVVAVRTNPNAEKAHKGISLLLIEADSEGLTRQLIPKIGLQAQDTAQIFFDNVKVPKSNLIGEENRGFYVLMQHLEAERIMPPTAPSALSSTPSRSPRSTSSRGYSSANRSPPSRTRSTSWLS